ncbi:hypothetical protein DN752_03385 [Echinicola strongylocentroti]|uniref:Uncharacterized protein n=1 Tax=Echinicola strongylocentroti TaxID=1795355 RepID=A0A2Z4IDW5_9BACT|nr:hypothetical protein DN752_03385 [Echinicola strongylocentroti]
MKHMKLNPIGTADIFKLGHLFKCVSPGEHLFNFPVITGVIADNHKRKKSAQIIIICVISVPSVPSFSA